MDLGRLLSRWWFIALVSFAIGIPSTWLVQSILLPYGPPSLGGDSPTLRLLWGTYFALAFGGGYAFSVTGLLLAFVPRHRVGGGCIPGPDDLERSGLTVVQRKGSYDVRMTSISTLRVYEGGIEFRCLPAPNALWAIALLSFAPQFSFFVLPVALSVHHQCFDGQRSLTAMSPPTYETMKVDVNHLVHDSLMNAYALAKNAADVRRSAFHERAIILVVIALVAWAVLIVLNTRSILGSDAQLGFLLETLIITILTISGVLILWRRSRGSVKREEVWATRLLSMMREEDGTSSPIGLLLDACHEVPSWLALRQEGVWVREPGRTLLVFILLTIGTNAFLQYGSIWWGFHFLGLSCFALGIYIFAVMKTAAGFEAREMAADWERRMKEMDTLLEPQGGR